MISRLSGLATFPGAAMFLITLIGGFLVVRAASSSVRSVSILGPVLAAVVFDLLVLLASMFQRSAAGRYDGLRIAVSG